MDIPNLLAKAPRGVSTGGCIWAQMRMNIYHKFGWSFVGEGAQRPNKLKVYKGRLEGCYHVGFLHQKMIVFCTGSCKLLGFYGDIHEIK